MSSSLPILTILEQAQVSPPSATVGDKVLPLTYFDFLWLRQHPIHYLFFYELSITKSQFIETLIPNLKHSLSVTLQHFFPFAGNLFVYSTSTQKPEIRYFEGDSVAVTFAECSLDFKELTGNHPRDCEMFYHLIPPLGQVQKTSDFTKVPLFFVQVTLFPNSGISIGMTNHHCLGDASTRFHFVKAWTSIARSGSDESFIANQTMPFYGRVAENPTLDESYLKFAQVEKFREYQPPKLCGPTDKVRATFILTRTVLNKLKNFVLTKLPTLSYASSYTIACAYMWSCIASTRENELQMFRLTINCRGRMKPAIPAAYFGNCVGWCYATEQTERLMGKEGFLRAAKLVGESLHETLNDKEGIMKAKESYDVSANGIIASVVGVAGTPKLKFYDMDFGFGRPTKIETISIDYNRSISMNACKENNDDFEIGVSLPVNKMECLVRTFEDGIETYV